MVLRLRCHGYAEQSDAVIIRMELGIERKGKKLTEEITLGSHPDDDSLGHAFRIRGGNGKQLTG